MNIFSWFDAGLIFILMFISGLPWHLYTFLAYGFWFLGWMGLMAWNGVGYEYNAWYVIWV